MNRINKLFALATIILLLISCTTNGYEKIPNCITNREIDDIVKSEYGFRIRTFFTDKIYYSPKVEDLKNDYEIVKNKLADDFNVPVSELRSIISNTENHDISIWDCDNVVRELKSAFDKIHYKRFLGKEHKINFEYAAFGAFGNHYLSGYHVYLMVFTEEREIYFIDFPDYIWSINEWKPKLSIMIPP